MTLVDGIDFLGYVVRATHRIVRRRVVGHVREKLRAWGTAHARRRTVRATPAEYRELAQMWASYVGHFSHAASGRLHGRLHREFPWLRRALMPRRHDHRWEGRQRSVRRGPRR